jgi:hypothetical protein
MHCLGHHKVPVRFEQNVDMRLNTKLFRGEVRIYPTFMPVDKPRTPCLCWWQMDWSKPVNLLVLRSQLIFLQSTAISRYPSATHFLFLSGPSRTRGKINLGTGLISHVPRIQQYQSFRYHRPIKQAGKAVSRHMSSDIFIDAFDPPQINCWRIG